MARREGKAPKTHVKERADLLVASGGVKKATTRKHKPGALTMRDIKRQQLKHTVRLVPRAAMSRLVREIAQGMNPLLRFKKGAIDSFHELGEDFVVNLMAAANLVRSNSSYKKLWPWHMQHAAFLARALPGLHRPDLPPKYTEEPTKKKPKRKARAPQKKPAGAGIKSFADIAKK